MKNEKLEERLNEIILKMNRYELEAFYLLNDSYIEDADISMVICMAINEREAELDHEDELSYHESLPEDHVCMCFK